MGQIMPLKKLETEPELDELLSDPIIHLLMQSDGVNREDLMPLIRRWNDGYQQA